MHTYRRRPWDTRGRGGSEAVQDKGHQGLPATIRSWRSKEVFFPRNFWRDHGTGPWFWTSGLQKLWEHTCQCLSQSLWWSAPTALGSEYSFFRRSCPLGQVTSPWSQIKWEPSSYSTLPFTLRTLFASQHPSSTVNNRNIFLFYCQSSFWNKDSLPTAMN